MAYSDAIGAVKEALRGEGFGVLTEIDERETLKKKIDVDFRPYIILGACDPSLAHQGLSAEPRIGPLLPCNVVVTEETAAWNTIGWRSCDPSHRDALFQESGDSAPRRRFAAPRIWRAVGSSPLPFAKGAVRRGFPFGFTAGPARD